MNPFRSLRDYEEFVYTLPQQFLSIAYSTLVVARRGARVVVVSGEVVFHSGHRLVVKERLTFDVGPLVITHYGYEVWRGGEKLYWYDSQPHPDDPILPTGTNCVFDTLAQCGMIHTYDHPTRIHARNPSSLELRAVLSPNPPGAASYGNAVVEKS